MKAWEAEKPQLTNPGALKGIIGFRGMSWAGSADTNNTALLTQVATLLSSAAGNTITESQLQAAITQAETQMKSNAVTQALANAVANGTITQDEANQIQSWWNQRPAAVDKLHGFGFLGRGFGGMMRNRGPWGGSPQTTPVTPSTTTTTPAI